MYSSKDLKKIIKKIFLKHGLKKNDALISAELIVYAEIVGASTHGVSRLKMYCDRIKKKLINPRPNIRIKHISQSISHIDADNCIGFVSANLGIKQAISNAKKSGIGMVGVKKSGHYGLSSYYIEQAVKKDYIAICFTNAPPAIAPYGSKKSLFGTNPIAFGVPVKSRIPFIFDSSMSKINRGKIRIAEKLGKSLPYGVALDKYGKLTTNPKDALTGVQLPIGDHRGSGLAWMVDILCGVFTGSSHGGKVKDPFEDFSGPQNIGHLFIVFKKNLFDKGFDKQIKLNIQRVKKLPRKDPRKKIRYPGEKKYYNFKNNLKKKIKLPKKVYNELQILINT